MREDSLFGVGSTCTELLSDCICTSGSLGTDSIIDEAAGCCLGASELDELTTVEALSELDKLSKIEELSSIDALIELEELSKLDKFTELKELAVLETLSELAALEKLSELEEIAMLDAELEPHEHSVNKHKQIKPMLIKLFMSTHPKLLFRA